MQRTRRSQNCQGQQRALFKIWGCQATPWVVSGLAHPAFGCRESEFADVDPRADNSQLHTAAEVTAPRRTTNFDNDHYADDLRSAFSGVPRLRHTWVDRYMKMLVVGESGQGMPVKPNDHQNLTQNASAQLSPNQHSHPYTWLMACQMNWPAHQMDSLGGCMDACTCILHATPSPGVMCRAVLGGSILPPLQ